MLDFEISKLLAPAALRQSIVEELERDMETVRLCREYEISERSKAESDFHDFKRDER